jgi:hypothetical protein
MPVIWILVIGGVLYWILRVFEAKHASQSGKQDVKPAAVQPAEASGESPDPADTVAAPEPDSSTETLPTGNLPFIDSIPGLTGETKTGLRELELTTPDAISNTPDKKLLAVKGIGPARLKQIRGLCADAMK